MFPRDPRKPTIEECLIPGREQNKNRGLVPDREQIKSKFSKIDRNSTPDEPTSSARSVTDPNDLDVNVDRNSTDSSNRLDGDLEESASPQMT